MNSPPPSTLFRRFYGIAFDQYGYFSQGMALTASSVTGSGTATTLTVSDPPTYAGSVFVSDLSSGLYVSITPLAPLPTTTILVPVKGSGVVSVTTDTAGDVIPVISYTPNADGSVGFGGRVVRITPAGLVNEFAYGFNVTSADDATSFIDSTLSIGFSADGTASMPPTIRVSGSS